MKLRDLTVFMEQKAPAALAEEWDKVGLLVDSGNADVSGVVVALDATPAAIAFAKERGANVLVTHHPVIFDPIVTLTPDHPAAMAFAAGISVFSAHTNLDSAAGGVNDTLAGLLGLTNVTVTVDGMTRVGTLPAPMTAKAFAALAATTLHTAAQVTVPDATISRIAVCGGAAGDNLHTAMQTADAYLTGELKHNLFLHAKAANFPVIAAGHYATEMPVVHTVTAWLRESFLAVDITAFEDTAPYITVM